MGTSTVQTTMYEPIEVGGSKWIHARSLFRPQEAACGLQSGGGALPFTKTDQPVSCPYCLAAMRPRTP